MKIWKVILRISFLLFRSFFKRLWINLQSFAKYGDILGM